MTTEALADLADQRMESIPGCAAIAAIVARTWPSWRVSAGRRPRLIAALERDDALLAESAAGQ